jgi:hypothetical protein
VIGEVIDGCAVGVAQVRHPLEVRSRGTQIPRGLHDCAPRAPGVRSRLPFPVGVARRRGRDENRPGYAERGRHGAVRCLALDCRLWKLDAGDSSRPTAKVAKDAKVFGADGCGREKAVERESSGGGVADG